MHTQKTLIWITACATVALSCGRLTESNRSPEKSSAVDSSASLDSLPWGGAPSTSAILKTDGGILSTGFGVLQLEKGAGSHFVKLTPTQQQSIISLAQNAKQTINDGKYVATWSELELNVYQESTAFTYTQVFHRTLKSARIVDVRIDSSSNLVQVVVSLRDHRIKLAESALDGAPHGECTWDKIEAPPTESPPSLNGPRPTVSNCGLIAAQTVQAKIFGHFLANCNDTHMLDIYDLTNAAKWLKVAAPNPYLDATVDTKVPTSSVVMCTNFFSTSDANTLGVRQNRAHIGFLHQTSAGALEAQSVIHPDAKDSTPSVTPTPPTPDAKPNAGTTVDLPPPGPSSTPQPPTSN